MKIAVIGANGRTGRLVVEDALARGHQVVAVTRTDRVADPGDDNLTGARADVHDADGLQRALVGADAVIVALPVLRHFFGASYDDMRRMETILQDTTDVDWISLRPPRLIKKPSKGAYRIDTRPLANARAITFGDLATALLDSLTRQDLYRHAAYVAN
jgi:putative NADH-flavin reductase